MTRSPKSLYLKSRSYLDVLLERDLLDDLRVMTLIMLMAQGFEWHTRSLVLSMAAAAIIFRGVRSHPATWFALALVLATQASLRWFSIDNHHYLYVYWVLALGLSTMVPADERVRVLGRSSRLIIGLLMAFATVQKILSASYVSGEFMEFILLCDPRFRPLAWLGGGVSLTNLAQNTEAVNSWVRDTAGLVPAALSLPTGGPRIAFLAELMTWATVAIDGAIAVAFLWPQSHPVVVRARTLLLIVFILVTYPIAPVVGFGWILIILGLAQVPVDCSRLRAVLLLLFLLLPVVYFSPAKVYVGLQRIFG